jgi:hypothetical protein
VTKQKSIQAGAENAEARRAEVIYAGGSFQIVALETGKARSPKLERRQQRVTGWRGANECRLESTVIADV